MDNFVKEILARNKVPRLLYVLNFQQNTIQVYQNVCKKKLFCGYSSRVESNFYNKFIWNQSTGN